MRILFASVGNFGHVHPLLPLALAARSAGHEVRFATGEQFHPILSAVGLEPVTAGRSVPDAFIEAAGGQAFLESQGGDVHPSELPPEVLTALGVKAFGSVLPRSIAADLVAVFESFRPDLVIHEVMNPGAGFAARLAGIPALSHGVGRLVSVGEEALIQEELRVTAAELGVLVADDQVRLLGHPYVDICPPSLQDADFIASGYPRIAQRPVPFDEPGELPAALAGSDRPLVYLSLGTALGSAAVLRTAIEGLAPLDVRVLVATGPTVGVDELGELPAHTVAVPWVSQAEVLRHASVVVQHGGSGTMLAALAAGLPQLFLPQGSDQPTNAEAVRALGAGEVLGHGELAPEAVTLKVKALLSDDSYRQAARRVADEIAAMPSPEEVAAGLSTYAG
ncbi:glycosyltransferase [Streptomyces sp. NPDC059037]|uniref:glycosyltransferase n=1 Tax=Streptomyces sp. NPDC059037 TaxID=3346710 RepID=UPI0036B4D211